MWQRPFTGASLTVSVVNFYCDYSRLLRTLESLVASAINAARYEVLDRLTIVIVNNGGELNLCAFVSSLPEWVCVSILHQEKNIGFGSAHNVAIASATSQYYLILNPDVVLSPDALCAGLSWLGLHESVVALAPQVSDSSGNLSYLCREKPTLGVLLLRAFGPDILRSAFSAALARYELRALIDRGVVVWDPPVISGCFMLFRTNALKELGGFDPAYFLYFEDYDLSHRAARLGRLAYVPMVRIAHFGGGAAKKGLRHIAYFCFSALRYFSTYGLRRVSMPRAGGQ